MEHSSFFRRWALAAVAVVFVFISSLDARAQGSSGYKRGAIIEEYTGTWCPHCPPGTWALDTLEKKYGDNLVIMAWHGPQQSYNEPLSIPEVDQMAPFWGISGWPTAIFNRAYSGGFGISNSVPIYIIGNYDAKMYMDPVLKSAPLMDYRIVNATYDASSRSVDFDVDITPYDITTMPKEDTSMYSTFAVLTEDNVVESQANAGDWSVVTQNPIDDFHHMNVVRKLSGEPTKGDKFTLGTPTTLPMRIHYTLAVDAAWNDGMIRAKTYIQNIHPKTKPFTFNVMEAKQTGYALTLPSIAPDKAWIVLPNSNTVTKPTAPVNIVWATGGSVSGNVKLDWSIDNGKTWNSIVDKTMNSPYAWTIPQAAYGGSAKVRITATSNPSATGMSEAFLTPGIITVSKPTAGESIDGGTNDYMITLTEGNVVPPVKYEYSLDAGKTWNAIGILGGVSSSYDWATVPNTASTQAMVRATDKNGVVGTSGIFTIKAVGNLGSFLTLNLGLTNNWIGNNKTLPITWTTNGGDVGTGIDISVSLDNGFNWQNVAHVAAGQTSYNWTTPQTGFYDKSCYVRVQSSSQPSLTIQNVDPFSIGAAAGVYTNAANGYSVSNYPNPFASQTTIKFTLPVSASVTINVTDNLGRVVDHLVTKNLEAGMHEIPFNASDLAGGVYTYTLDAAQVKLVGKMSVVK